MKKKKLKKKNASLLIIVLLLVIYIIYYFFGDIGKYFDLSFAKKFKPKDIKEKIEEVIILEKSNFANNIIFNNTSDYSIDIETAITKFLNLYYKSIYYLEENDFTEFFEADNEESYLTNKAISYQINVRKAESNDLTLKNAYYDLEITDIEETSDTITVKVLEDAYLNYNFMKDITSKMYDIKNEFIFNKDFKLISYRRVQDFYVTFTNNMDYITRESVDYLYNIYLDAKKTEIQGKSESYLTYLENPTYSYECNHDYDRESALKYAETYITTRNTDKWPMFDAYGGNCQNFASQVLIAGGIPMDTTGDYVWKYYGSSPNNYAIKEGRSGSWAVVGSFYTYAKWNTGFGLCSEVDVNPFYAEAGDVMQVGYDDFFVHTLVTSGTIKKDGIVVDVLTNSNTVNHQNVPISALAYPQIRLIKINGWND